ncbi:hypothetical protein ABFY60_19350 [Lysinibacillus pakistanensis]|uniref:hypothetical protein n=1 Tax=Lysinibacillus pakistanensis TaxID=759811 RepID=UPI003D285F72
MSYTVENVSRVLNRLDMCFTVDASKRLVDRKLKKVERPSHHYNTSFNYLVDVQSLEEYSINECRLDANLVHSAIYGGNQ